MLSGICFVFLGLPAKLGSFGKSGCAAIRGGAKCPKLGLGSFGKTGCAQAWRRSCGRAGGDSEVCRRVRIAYLSLL